jgi:hypothetical protein
MSFLSFCALIAILTGTGVFLLRRLRMDSRLNLLELATCGLIVGGLINYAIVETIGRWTLTIWPIGITYGVLLPISIIGLRTLYSLGRPQTENLIARINAAGLLCQLQMGALAVLAIVGAVQSFAPPNTYDTLNYQLFLPQYDVARGFYAPRWDHNVIFSFFPSYLSHLTRTALLFGDASTAQLINSLLVILAAAGAANLAYFIKGDLLISTFAALLVLLNRAVTWQLPTLEIDATLGVFASMSAVLLLKLHNDQNWNLAVLTGIVIGCATLSKYHGFVLAVAVGLAFLFIHVRTGRKNFQHSAGVLSIVTAAAFIVASLHFLRNYLFVGDPLYPLFALHDAGLSEMHGTGRGILDLLAAPFLMGLMPRSYFDGMMFGAPLLLALIPLCAFVRPTSSPSYFYGSPPQFIMSFGFMRFRSKLVFCFRSYRSSPYWRRWVRIMPANDLGGYTRVYWSRVSSACSLFKARLSAFMPCFVFPRLSGL